MVWSIFQYENSFITTTEEEINGVPSLKFKPKGYDGLLPTVIYYHGWHSSKDFKRFEALTIASHGYQVIVPDALQKAYALSSTPPLIIPYKNFLKFFLPS